MSDIIYRIYMEALNDGILSGEHRNEKEFLYIPVYSKFDKVYPLAHLYAMKKEE